jgi:hypothetical protein
MNCFYHKKITLADYSNMENAVADLKEKIESLGGYNISDPVIVSNGCGVTSMIIKYEKEDK